MRKTVYTINNKDFEVSLEDSPEFFFGKDELLSSSSTDITFHQDWYREGHTSCTVLDDQEYANLRKGISLCIAHIIETELAITTEDFDLEKYHEVVTNDSDHARVVTKTRELFPEDFSFAITEIIPKFENILGFGLTDVNPHNSIKLPMILRINRPLSTDFNPPHKDIYGRMDKSGYIPQYVNLWIPVCGVTSNSSLPIVPGSHLIPEAKILRTLNGGVVSGNTYNVRTIKEWDGSRTLFRAGVDYGQVLIFSSHLIHGLAVNDEPDRTRVALEFRLFKKNS
jgi:hypothetical protein